MMWKLFDFLKKKDNISEEVNNTIINKIVKKQLLNKNQKKLFCQINQFFNQEENGQDKERVLAIFFLIQSIATPDTPIFISIGNKGIRRNIVSLIKKILANYSEIENKMIYYETSIMYVGENKNEKH